VTVVGAAGAVGAGTSSRALGAPES
jgi:hypothetical protein